VKTRILVTIFTIGIFALITILWLGLARPGEPATTVQPTYVKTVDFLLGALGAVIAVLVFMGIFVSGEERWMALALVATLLLLFSVLAIFSIGIFIAPVALLLLGFSLWKYRHSEPKRA
jgi:hypothetical protein